MNAIAELMVRYHYWVARQASLSLAMDRAHATGNKGEIAMTANRLNEAGYCSAELGKILTDWGWGHLIGKLTQEEGWLEWTEDAVREWSIATTR